MKAEEEDGYQIIGCDLGLGSKTEEYVLALDCTKEEAFQLAQIHFKIDHKMTIYLITLSGSKIRLFPKEEN